MMRIRFLWRWLGIPLMAVALACILLALATGLAAHVYGELDGASFSYTDPTGATVTFTPQSIINPEATKIYEVHPGITQGWAATLMDAAPDVYEGIELGYNRITGAPEGTIGDLALQASGSYVKTFHFVLNNYIVDDTRIPPYGMSYDKALKRNALPVPEDQYGNDHRHDR